jgi:hypothetical protein
MEVEGARQGEQLLLGQGE